MNDVNNMYDKDSDSESEIAPESLLERADEEIPEAKRKATMLASFNLVCPYVEQHRNEIAHIFLDF